jgi:succinoglycan biosynthesis protein ExoM
MKGQIFERNPGSCRELFTVALSHGLSRSIDWIRVYNRVRRSKTVIVLDWPPKGSCTIRMESLTEINKVGLTVCICTFRRAAALSATLESVAKQKLTSDLAVRILVIDNDNEPTAQCIVEDFRRGSVLDVGYKHAPGENISIARNAALEAVATPWLAFIDDDEYAATDWLSKLLASRHGANAIFGPCEAIYDNETPDWIKRGNYHSNHIFEPGDAITTGHTANALIDMNFVRRNRLQFEHALGRTGGEDTMFFRAMHRRGGVLRYAPEAIVYENVVRSRINIKWIMRRRYRAGQVRALVAHRLDRSGYRRLSWAAPAKVAICLFMSVFTMPNPTRAMWWLMRGLFHAGTLSYVLGFPVHEEYAMSRR